MKQRVLVCGSGGFIGRNIFETLSQRPDLEVWGADIKEPFRKDPRSRLIKVDLREKEWVKAVLQNTDIVIHAAAVTNGMDAVIRDPAKYVADNILMNTLLAEAAYENKIRHFIFLSCTVMYQSSERPLLEEEYDLERILPEYYMGARIKVNMEDLCNFYSRNGDTRFTMLRPSSTCGPYDKFDPEKSHVFDSLIMRIADSPDNSVVTVRGDGTGMRDFIHVSDVVKFVEMIMINPSSFRVYNVASGFSVSVLELAERIVRISGKKIRIECDKTKSNLPNHLRLDISRAQSRGWQPMIDLDTNIKMTLNWYRQNRGDCDVR